MKLKEPAVIARKGVSINLGKDDLREIRKALGDHSGSMIYRKYHEYR